MSKRSDLLYLGRMLDAARKVQARAAGVTRAEFDGDEDVQVVLTHFIQIIGEAARQTPDVVRKTYPQIPWERIIGMRHRVVHDYMHVDPKVVWGPRKYTCRS